MQETRKSRWKAKLSPNDGNHIGTTNWEVAPLLASSLWCSCGTAAKKMVVFTYLCSSMHTNIIFPLNHTYSLIK
jgi:hypothetical protein